MQNILSIQSHVVSGYVGNRAATFPLQRLGYDVSVINTVQFSNHTGYGKWSGQVFSAAHIAELIDTLRTRGLLQHFDGLLSGYLGDAALGQIVLETAKEIKTLNPNAIYCCDPVMGDVGRGIFVQPDIPAMFRDKLTPAATILTPNLFEAELLTDTKIQNLADARTACRILHQKGIKIVLLTSLLHQNTPQNTIQMLASTDSGADFLLTSPYITLKPMPNGMGDLTSALFLGYYLHKADIAYALTRTATGLIHTLTEASKIGGRELPIIAAQQYFALDCAPHPAITCTPL